MNVKFHIEELGTIVKSEIELKHFLLFSGNSNLGKSYAALMIYSFYEIINNDAEWEKFQKYFWKEKLYNNISEFPTFIDFSFETFENMSGGKSYNEPGFLQQLSYKVIQHPI